MPSFDIFYLFFNLLLLWVMFYEGYKISKGKPYWECSTWIILTFTLVEGLRYARGVDYLHYLDVYNFNLEDSQVGFTLFNDILKVFGVPAECAFFFYAFGFISGAMVLLRPMKKYMAYLLPIFLMIIIGKHEAFIRQMFAMSFVFLFIGKLDEVLIKRTEKGHFERKDIAILLFLFILSYSMHSIAVVAIFLTAMIMVFIKKPFRWQYTIPIFLFCKFVVAKIFDWGSLGLMFDMLSESDEKMADYANNSDAFFSADAEKDKYTQNIAIQGVGVIGICALFYQGERICNYLLSLEQRKAFVVDLYKSLSITQSNKVLRCIQLIKKLKQEKNHGKLIRIEYGRASLYTALFNSSVFGIILLQTFFNLELMRRIALCWHFYCFVPMALILYYCNNKKLFTVFDQLMMFGFLYWFWDYYRFLFVWKETPQFLWDIL